MEANEHHAWHICADFAQVLIARARVLQAHDSFGADSSTAPMLWTRPPSICVWPRSLGLVFASAVKMHTLIDLHGNIPLFICVAGGKVRDVNILDPIVPVAGAFYVMDRGYLDFERLYRLTLAAAFVVTRTKPPIQW